MHPALHDLQQWDQLNDEDRLHIVRSLNIPVFSFTDLETCAQGDQRHRIAVFDGPDGRFALIPGGRATLGWDRGALALTDEQRDAWQSGLTHLWGDDRPPEQVIDEWMTPAREVTVDPLLVEVEPQRGENWIPEEAWDDDEFDDPIKGLQDVLAKDGFRLPSSDEWAWLYRGGASTFFRWGDEWPEGEPYLNRTPFTGHKQPNAFGLRFTDDPYLVECVGGDVGFRVGDGGCSLCGGTPEPYPWHVFASAYLYPAALADEVLFEFFEEARFRRIRAVSG